MIFILLNSCCYRPWMSASMSQLVNRKSNILILPAFQLMARYLMLTKIIIGEELSDAESNYAWQLLKEKHPKVNWLRTVLYKGKLAEIEKCSDCTLPNKTHNCYYYLAGGSSMLLLSVRSILDNSLSIHFLRCRF